MAQTAQRTDWGAVALVVAGGALGTILRFGASQVIHAGRWPWATLAVNLAGALLLGLCSRLGNRRRAFLGAGFCGGLTTYSTLALDVARGAEHAPLSAGAYLLVTLAGGLVAAWLGRRLVGVAHG